MQTRVLPQPFAATQPGYLDKLAMKAVFAFLERLKRGRLEVVLPSGEVRILGKGAASPSGTIIVREYGFFRRILLNGDIGFGESYMLGEWETPHLTSCLQVFAENMDVADDREIWSQKALRIANRIRHQLRRNTLTGSRENIEYHYDLGNDFYRLFLDETMMYSCACFASPEDSLAEAQCNKIRMLLDKADIKPGQHLLEIGSGWGSLAIEAAKTRDCRVTTITLSREQFQAVRQRVRKAKLEGRVEVILRDYRKMEGQFDRIISVEMLEAVGHEYYGEYFRQVDRLLKPDGLAVIQVITIPDQRYEAYRRNTDWIQKYIFPGAVVPSLTALSNAMTAHSRLIIENLENIGVHYARTLREWHEAFDGKRAEVRALGFDEKFCRMWDYYLSYCEAGFESRVLGTLQLVLTRANNRSLPKSP